MRPFLVSYGTYPTYYRAVVARVGVLRGSAARLLKTQYRAKELPTGVAGWRIFLFGATDAPSLCSGLGAIDAHQEETEKHVVDMFTFLVLMHCFDGSAGIHATVWTPYKAEAHRRAEALACLAGGWPMARAGEFRAWFLDHSRRALVAALEELGMAGAETVGGYVNEFIPPKLASSIALQIGTRGMEAFEARRAATGSDEEQDLFCWISFASEFSRLGGPVGVPEFTGAAREVAEVVARAQSALRAIVCTLPIEEVPCEPVKLFMSDAEVTLHSYSTEHNNFVRKNELAALHRCRRVADPAVPAPMPCGGLANARPKKRPEQLAQRQPPRHAQPVPPSIFNFRLSSLQGLWSLMLLINTRAFMKVKFLQGNMRIAASSQP